MKTRHRSRRLPAGVAALVAAAGLVVLVARPDTAGAADDPETLLEGARTASSRQSFTGLLRLTWRAADGVHHSAVVARAAHGSIKLGFVPSGIAARGLKRWMVGQAGWREVWDEPQPVGTPRPGAHWDLEVAGYERVAGRNAARVVASDPDTGRVRARYWIDTQTGILLRKEIRDTQGRVERALEFTVITRRTSDEPEPPRHAPGRPPRAIVRVPDGYPAPRHVDGYRLLSRYRHDNGSVQLFYSDGLFTMSLFEQSGDVDWDALPHGVERDVEGTRTRSFSTATATVVVWGQGGLTITCVGDAPHDELVDVMRTLHASSGSDAFEDVADFVLGPFGWD